MRTAPPSGPLPTVLLVDDVPEIRAMVRRAIEARGCLRVVGEASRGVAAVTLVEELEPDIVVLDLGLPDITGRDVLTRVRELRPATRVVIFSGHEPEDRTWFEKNTEAFLAKDVDLGYLVELLESLVSPRTDEVALTLPQDLESVRQARQFVSRTMTGWGVPGVIDEASIVVTELASNAVLHAGSAYEVRLSLNPQSVRIEVRDHGAGTPEPRPPTESGESGRGLFMVAALSASWGFESGSPGEKVVWSELVRPAAPGPDGVDGTAAVS